jgi:Resolvase, N terminal domain
MISTGALVGGSPAPAFPATRESQCPSGVPGLRGKQVLSPGHMWSGRGAFHILGSGTAAHDRHAGRETLGSGRPTGRCRKGVPFPPYVWDIRYGAAVELGYARVSTVKQDLDRQIDALEQAGIPRERIYVDKKSGATTDRPGLRELIAYAREGDVIVVHTLDRLGRTVRDTLNLIHELAERKVGVRNLARCGSGIGCCGTIVSRCSGRRSARACAATSATPSGMTSCRTSRTTTAAYKRWLEGNMRTAHLNVPPIDAR